MPGTVGAWRGIDACCRCLFKYFPSLCFFPALGGGSLVFRGELLADDGGGVGGGTEASACNNAGDNIKTCLYTITALSGHCETTSCKLQYSRGWYLFYLPAQIIFKALAFWTELLSAAEMNVFSSVYLTGLRERAREAELALS